MHDAGILKYYTLTNTAAPGLMPKEQLVLSGSAYYFERTIGATRAYNALAANQRIDKLVRCYNSNIPVSVEYAILEDGNQYRINLKQVQGDHVDLTLERLEEFLDVSPEQDTESSNSINGNIEP